MTYKRRNQTKPREFAPKDNKSSTEFSSQNTYQSTQSNSSYVSPGVENLFGGEKKLATNNNNGGGKKRIIDYSLIPQDLKMVKNTVNANFGNMLSYLHGDDTLKFPPESQGVKNWYKASMGFEFGVHGSIPAVLIPLYYDSGLYVNAPDKMYIMPVGASALYYMLLGMPQEQVKDTLPPLSYFFLNYSQVLEKMLYNRMLITSVPIKSNVIVVRKTENAGISRAYFISNEQKLSNGGYKYIADGLLLLMRGKGVPKAGFSMGNDATRVSLIPSDAISSMRRALVSINGKDVFRRGKPRTQSNRTNTIATTIVSNTTSSSSSSSNNIVDNNVIINNIVQTEEYEDGYDPPDEEEEEEELKRLPPSDGQTMPSLDAYQQPNLNTNPFSNISYSNIPPQNQPPPPPPKQQQQQQMQQQPPPPKTQQQQQQPPQQQQKDLSRDQTLSQLDEILKSAGKE